MCTMKKICNRSMLLISLLIWGLAIEIPVFADTLKDQENLSAEGEVELEILQGPSNYWLDEDDKSTLIVEVTPADASVSVVMDDESIASLEPYKYQNYDYCYKIVPHKYGRTYFTVTASKDGKSISEEGDVIVYCSDFYYAENGEEITKIRIPSDQKYTVSYGFPEGFDGADKIKNMSWSSEDKTIFTVRNGVITPKSTGKSRLWTYLEKALNYSPYVDDLYKSIEVEVFDRVQSITTDKERYEGYPGDIIQIQATALPDNAEDKTLLFSSNNKDFLVDNTGKVTISNTATGTATITVTAKDTGLVTKEVEVSAIDVIKSIKPSAERIIVIPGDSIQLETVMEPKVENGLSFSSSSENISVDEKGMVKVSEKISKDEEAVISIKAKDTHSVAKAEIIIDVKTNVAGEIYNVNEGSTLEYAFRTSSDVKSADMIKIRNLDGTIARGEKIEKNSDGRYTLTITGIKRGNTGIILTAVVDRETSFYQYVNVTVLEKKVENTTEDKPKDEIKPQPKEETKVEPTVDVAEKQLEVAGVTYEVDGTEATAVSSRTKKGTIKIKSSVVIGGNTYKVTKIKKGAFKKTKASKLVIPASVKEIGDSAFEGSSLTQVTIGKNVTKVGKKAFYNSKKLKKIIVKGKKIKKVGKNAFKKLNKNVVFKLPKGMKLPK